MNQCGAATKARSRIKCYRVTVEKVGDCVVVGEARIAINLHVVTDVDSRIQEEFQDLNVRVTPALAKIVQRYDAWPNDVDNRLAVSTLHAARGYVGRRILNSRVQKTGIAESEAGVGRQRRSGTIAFDRVVSQILLRYRFRRRPRRGLETLKEKLV